MTGAILVIFIATQTAISVPLQLALGVLPTILAVSVVAILFGCLDGISMVKAGDTEVPFETLSTSDTATTIKFTVPDGSNSVEISGATVVPEFGLIAVLVLGAVLVAVIGLARFKGNWMNLQRF